MHVAICDDNIADRKQLERLLQRESDARISSTGVLYIDSFGNDTALFGAPMTYDLYFIDMTEGDKNGLEVAWELRKSGVFSPIVLCNSSIYYPSFRNQPENIFHLEKPLKVAEIKEKLDISLAMKNQKVHTIEIRCEKCTKYIQPCDIVYVVPSNHLSLIHCQDGAVIDMFGSLNEFYYLVEQEEKFIFARKNMIVNIDYISSVTLTKLKLTTGDSFSIHIGDWKFIKKYWPVRKT